MSLFPSESPFSGQPGAHPPPRDAPITGYIEDKIASSSPLARRVDSSVSNSQPFARPCTPREPDRFLPRFFATWIEVGSDFPVASSATNGSGRVDPDRPSSVADDPSSPTQRSNHHHHPHTHIALLLVVVGVLIVVVVPWPRSIVDPSSSSSWKTRIARAWTSPSSSSRVA